MTSEETTAIKVVERLRNHGHIAYFAGGCVRDRLLGVEAKDYDIATDATTDQVRAIFPRTIPVGVHFGVILVVLDGIHCEVATFRTDGSYRDGRHPSEIHFGSPREDALRRDFTINGMFYDPLTGEVIDYVGGIEDLRRCIIRAIGDPVCRFQEDKLRMMRAVRFAAQLGFSVDSPTYVALVELGSTVTQIAWERIGDELVRILTQGSARRGYELLEASGLLRWILPEVASAKHVSSPNPSSDELNDKLEHTLSILEHLDELKQPTETLALAAVLHDISERQCRLPARIQGFPLPRSERAAELSIHVCKRLKRSRPTWEKVQYLVRNLWRVHDAVKMRTADLKRFLRKPHTGELLELTRLHALGSNERRDAYDFCLRKLQQLSSEDLSPPPFVDGRDLIRLGLKPGPCFSRILSAIEDAQLEGLLNSRQEALEMLERKWKSGQS